MRCYRFFGGLMSIQEKWLNKMADKGYRLVRVEKLLYEFEECSPKQVQYCVEFIGEKSKENAQNYYDFLEEMGYKVFYKNINLNYSIGKVRWRPWAEKGGKVATNATTFNRELLIVEKEKDGKPFALHTSYEDKENYFQNLRRPWLYLAIFLGIFSIIYSNLGFGAMAILALIPVMIYQWQIQQLKKEAKTKEW